jgi:hypothetical protein
MEQLKTKREELNTIPGIVTLREQCNRDKSNNLKKAAAQDILDVLNGDPENFYAFFKPRADKGFPADQAILSEIEKINKKWGPKEEPVVAPEQEVASKVLFEIPASFPNEAAATVERPVKTVLQNLEELNALVEAHEGPGEIPDLPITNSEVDDFDLTALDEPILNKISEPEIAADLHAKINAAYENPKQEEAIVDLKQIAQKINALVELKQKRDAEIFDLPIVKEEIEEIKKGRPENPEENMKLLQESPLEFVQNRLEVFNNWKGTKQYQTERLLHYAKMQHALEEVYKKYDDLVGDLLK